MVKFLSIGTHRSVQSVQTQIRLLLKEQSDQGLHCLPSHLHLLDIVELNCPSFRTVMEIMLGLANFKILAISVVPILRIFMVITES